MQNDFRDMLSAFSDAGVEYLLVGGHAVSAHGLLRATKDMDLWVRRTRENAERIMRALKAFGAPTSEITLEDLRSADLIFQIGVPPVRIDIVTGIEGVEFEEAWPNRYEWKSGGLTVPVIGREELIRNKKAVGRPQDLADVARLREIE